VDVVCSELALGSRKRWMSRPAYSLESVQSRPAKVGDRLYARLFRNQTRGFSALAGTFLIVSTLPGIAHGRVNFGSQPILHVAEESSELADPACISSSFSSAVVAFSALVTCVSIIPKVDISLSC
jgi:hypothetical protein